MKKILAITVVLLFGCGERARQPTESQPPTITNNHKWKILAPYIKRHFTTDMTIEEIATELAYREYLMNKKGSNGR